VIKGAGDHMLLVVKFIVANQATRRWVCCELAALYGRLVVIL